MISIIATTEDLIEATQIIAQQWGFIFSTSTDAEFYLQLSSQGLQLIQKSKNSPGPIRIDFSSGQNDHRRRFGGGKGQTIAKAVGLNKIDQPIILDATAGMGKDAFVFASLGAQVILMDRSKISAALLCDALQRGLQDNNIAEIIKRMHFIYGDARYLYSPQSAECNQQSIVLDKTPDVIYLDPMFPHRKKSALVKKEMLIFQKLIGDDNDSDDLLNICKQIATKRVVVKRPIKAAYLNKKEPSVCMKMKKHRFDVYFCNKI